MRRLAFFVGVFLFSVPISWAENSPSVFKKAMSLMNTGKAKEAYSLLKKGYNPKKTHPQELFLLGLAAKQSGNLQDASMYLELSLKIDPKANRIKLELASIYYKLRQKESSKRLFLEVRASNPPASVRKNINKFLTSLNQKALTRTASNNKNWQASVSAGVVYDTNANAGPSIDTVTLFGLPFTLSSDAQDTEDKAFVLSADGSHTLPISDISAWKTSVYIKKTDYDTLHNLDSLYLYGSTGLLWKPQKDTLITLPLFGNIVDYGSSDKYYYHSVGVSPSVQYSIDKQTTLNLNSSLSKKLYRDNHERDLNAWSISPLLGYQLSKADYLRIGGSISAENSGLDYYSNDSRSMNLFYTHSFAMGLNLSLTASYTDTKYEGIEDAYDEARHDHTRYIGLDLSYNIKQIDADLILSMSYTDNDSNLEMYEYDRSQVSLMLKKKF